MTDREQRIYEEATALWLEVFHEPPPALADGPSMLAVITRSLGDSTYERLRSPFLRPSTIVGPGQPTDDSQLN